MITARYHPEETNPTIEDVVVYREGILGLILVPWSKLMHKHGQHAHYTGRKTQYMDGLNIVCRNLQILCPLTTYRLLFLFYTALYFIHCTYYTTTFVASKTALCSDQRYILLFTHWVVCIESHSKSPQTGKEFFFDISEKEIRP